VSDIGSLLDLRSSKRNKSNIVTRQLNLILHIRRTNVLDALQKLHLPDTLLSQEVTDLNSVSRKGHIDGEMRVYETHLVKESLGDTNHHVVNVRADGTDACELLTGGEPDVDADRGLSDLFEVHLDVLEVT